MLIRTPSYHNAPTPLKPSDDVRVCSTWYAGTLTYTVLAHMRSVQLTAINQLARIVSNHSGCGGCIWWQTGGGHFAASPHHSFYAAENRCVS